nr:protein kinase-like domain-containing protein [Tanacetum cinerariifolium]
MIFSILQQGSAPIVNTTASSSGECSFSHTQKNKINAPKSSAKMAPIIVISKCCLASTSQKPHEMWSKNEYMGHIKAAISKSSISLGE